MYIYLLCYSHLQVSIALVPHSSQDRNRLVKNSFARRRQVGHIKDAVKDTKVPGRDNFNTSLQQLASVCLTFVSENVGLGRDDQRRRQPLQIVNRGTERRCRYLRAILLIRNIVIPEPLHLVSCQIVVSGKCCVRLGIKVSIGDRVVQHLVFDGG